MATRSKKPPPTGQTLHSLLNQANRQAITELRRMVGAEGIPVEFWRALEVRGRAQGGRQLQRRHEGPPEHVGEVAVQAS